MHRIKNYESLALTPARGQILDIMEAGLDAIDTSNVIERNISCEGNGLKFGELSINLEDVRNIHVIGFGKASCQAAQSLEKILGQRICSGLVIGNTTSSCEIISTYKGTHPKPSAENVERSGEMLEKLKSLSDKDLVIVLVSGGGSSLLCWPQNECDQSMKLYDASVNRGMTIKELNIIRKHLSSLKGGGLAKMLYPAHVIGLIFSDVPGDDYDMVASGPTYYDASTISDAQAVIEKYSLGHFDLQETPKEQKWFERVTNIVLVSNDDALEAMSRKAQSLGYEADIMSDALYAEPKSVIEKMVRASAQKKIVLAGGEYKFRMTKPGGKGGRNQQAVLESLGMIGPEQTFVSLASDGEDNSDVAGAIADIIAQQKLAGREDEVRERIELFDSYPILKEIDSLIMTGPTSANVSDLAILLTK